MGLWVWLWTCGCDYGLVVVIMDLWLCTCCCACRLVVVCTMVYVAFICKCVKKLIYPSYHCAHLIWRIIFILTPPPSTPPFLPSLRYSDLYHLQAVSKEEKASLQDRLTPLQIRVTQDQGTERAFTGEFVKHKQLGTYGCVVCGQVRWADRWVNKSEFLITTVDVV